jgi:hypothetical protein
MGSSLPTEAYRSTGRAGVQSFSALEKRTSNSILSCRNFAKRRGGFLEHLTREGLGGEV